MWMWKRGVAVVMTNLVLLGRIVVFISDFVLLHSHELALPFDLQNLLLEL